MSVIPKKNSDRLDWYETRLPKWTLNAVAIGTTASDVSNVETKAEAARAARVAQLAALSTARTKTEAFYAAMRALSLAGAGVVKQVRAKGETTGNPNVYELAEIPAPAIPAPVGPPGQPYGFKVSLDGNGSLIMTWKANNPSGSQGTTYRIYRTIAGGQQVYIAGAGARKFIDETVPAGATHVTYDIQGVRSTAAGMWGTFVVKFGTNAGGEATASIANAVGPKLAA